MTMPKTFLQYSSIISISAGYGVSSKFGVLCNAFIFSPKNFQFHEITTACGDEFIDPKVLTSKKRLLSIYFSEGIPRRCKTMPTQRA